MDLGEDGGGGLDGIDRGDGKGTFAVALADFTPAGVGLQIVEQFAEDGRLIVGAV